MIKYQATQVMIAFHVEGDKESDLISLLQTIVRIALALWDCWQWVSRTRRQLKACWQDLRQAAAAAAAEIGNLWSFELSITFGVG